MSNYRRTKKLFEKMQRRGATIEGLEKCRELCQRFLLAELSSGKHSLSYSSFKHFITSPYDFIQYRLPDMELKKRQDFFVWGDLVETCLWEPDDIEKKFGVYERDYNLRLKVDKADKSTFDRLHYPKDCVTKAQIKEAKKTVLRIKNDPKANDLLMQITSTQSKYDFEYLGRRWVCILDAEGEDIIVDLKTTKDARPSKFERDVFQLGYYLQAVLYCIATNFEKSYYIIAVSQKGVGVYRLPDAALEFGLEVLKKYLKSFDECQMRDAWLQSYSFHKGIVDIEVPNWTANNILH